MHGKLKGLEPLCQCNTSVFSLLSMVRKTQEMVAERAIELAASEHADLVFGHVVDLRAL